jgi:hypothetical protein
MDDGSEAEFGPAMWIRFLLGHGGVDSWERTFYQHRLPRLPYNGSTTNGNMTSGSAVKALGEVALRVNNLERMKCFYQEVLGLRSSWRISNCGALEDRRRLCRPHPSARRFDRMRYLLII